MGWNKLCTILAQQLNDIKSLLDLYEQERVALCRLNSELLEEIVTQKNLVIEHFKKLEQDRIQLCMNLKVEKMTLKEIINIAPLEFSEILSELYKELKKFAKKLDEMGKINHSLIINAQTQTELLISTLGTINIKTYSHKGRLENQSLSALNRRI